MVCVLHYISVILVEHQPTQIRGCSYQPQKWNPITLLLLLLWKNSLLLKLNHCVHQLKNDYEGVFVWRENPQQLVKSQFDITHLHNYFNLFICPISVINVLSFPIPPYNS